MFHMRHVWRLVGALSLMITLLTIHWWVSEKEFLQDAVHIAKRTSRYTLYIHYSTLILFGSLLIISLQVSYWMCRWKNYENRSIFSKDMDKSIVSPFFWPTVYIRWNFYGGLRKFCLFLQEWRFSRSRTSKVIDFGANQKRVCKFLLVLHSNLGPILHHFGDIAGFCALDPTPILPSFWGGPVAPDQPYWGRCEQGLWKSLFTRSGRNSRK